MSDEPKQLRQMRLDPLSFLNRCRRVLPDRIASDLAIGAGPRRPRRQVMDRHGQHGLIPVDPWARPAGAAEGALARQRWRRRDMPRHAETK